MTDHVSLTDDIVRQFRAYHAGHPAWGSLHVVLEDVNTDDGSVLFCVEYALAQGDEEGARLAHLMRSMSRTQRRKLAHIA